ncbi:class I adenylate-forming enzyme family protein [Kitasatospora sp. NPDC057223]|uniref:class I adenylate-forming enzyme family protein n=1 Tax=Kitasatospora sp. NPDC057223 TaxID=3346055 RepID=UPI0036449BE3
MIKLQDALRHAAERPDHIALVDGGRRITWSELADEIAKVAGGLAGTLPAGRPARAAFLCCNGWELVIVTAAFETLGVPVTGLDFEESAEATADALDQLAPTVVVSSRLHRPLLIDTGWHDREGVLQVHLHGVGEELAAPEPIVKDPQAGEPVAYSTLAAAQSSVTTPLTQPFESFAVSYGADGAARLVVRHKSSEARRQAELVDEFGLDEHDTYLATVPMHHASSPGWARIFLSLGGTLVLGPYHDLDELARLIVEESVTATLMVAPVLSRLLASPASAELYATSSLRLVLTGGQHLNRWIVNEAWDRLGPVLHHYYGSTETGLVTVLGPDELQISPCRSGRAMPGVTIAVLDPEDRPLPPGLRGRVAVAGPHVMDAYGDGPAPTTVVDLGDGLGRRTFLPTGDTGVIDYEGRLELTGRTAGVPVAGPADERELGILRLEAELLHQPGVRDVAVLRTALPDRGEVLAVPFVPVAADLEATAHRALTATCARRAPGLPVHVVAVTAIPYSPTGKIRTRELLAEALPLINLHLHLDEQSVREISA